MIWRPGAKKCLRLQELGHRKVSCVFFRPELRLGLVFLIFTIYSFWLMYKWRGRRVHLTFLNRISLIVSRPCLPEAEHVLLEAAIEWISIYAACSLAEDMFQFLRAKSTGLSAALWLGRTSTSAHPERLQDETKQSSAVSGIVGFLQQRQGSPFHSGPFISSSDMVGIVQTWSAAYSNHEAVCPVRECFAV